MKKLLINYPGYYIDEFCDVYEGNVKLIKYKGVKSDVVKIMKNNIMHVEYVKDLKNNRLLKNIKLLVNLSNKPKRIVCFETGQEWESVNKCVAEVGEGVKMCLYGRSESHRNRHYKFVGN